MSKFPLYPVPCTLDSMYSLLIFNFEVIFLKGFCAIEQTEMA
jgi:hypothetical protein